MSEIVIKSTKPQLQFKKLTCRYPAFIAGFASGKTEELCQDVTIGLFHGGDLDLAIYAPTYKMLRAVIYPRMLFILDGYKIGYKATLNPLEISTTDPDLANIKFHSLDDPNSIRSYEFYRIYVDELDTLKPDKAEEAWNLLIGRCRQTSAKPMVAFPSNRVHAYTTPEGFGFVYKRWVKNEGDDPDYGYVKASTYSNPYVPKDYIESIKRTYPEQLARAYLYGEFVNLTSGTVYRSYNRKDCSSNETIQDREPIFVGMDFNIDHMAATVYVKRDKVWHAVDEISEAYDTKAVISILKDRYKDNVIHVYPDSSGKNRSTASGSGAAESDIALLEQAGFRCRYNNVNPRIKDRVSAMNNSLEKGLVKVNADRCPNVVDCLEQQSYDANGAPDKKSGKDHQNDATTYVIAYEMPISKPALDIPVSFAL